jgi:hypothetical protein
MGGFSLSDSHFLHREGHAVDFFGENARREVVGHAFSSDPIESWSHGCASPHSLGVEALMVDQWARPSLSARLESVAGGSRPFTILGLPLTIPCVVHEQSSLCHYDGISYRVSGIDSLIWPFHRLLRVGTTIPFLTFSFLTA